MRPALYVPVLHGATADRLDEIDTLDAARAVQAALSVAGFESDIVHTGRDLAAFAAFERRRPDLVFNLVEALDGRCDLADLAFDRLEALDLAHTGVGAEALRRTTDKLAAKAELAAAGLPTPAWSLDGRDPGLTGTVIVKSVAEHASLGLDAGSVVPAAQAAAEIVRRESKFGGRFFAESYVEGREFNLSLLDGALLPPAEIDFIDFPPDRPRIVDWDAKWVEESVAFRNTPRRFAFPPADADLLRRLEALALKAWRLFDLAGYARVDFRVDGPGAPWVLEVNANPCLTPDAGFAAAAARGGLDYVGLIARIARAGLARARAAKAA